MKNKKGKNEKEREEEREGKGRDVIIPYDTMYEYDVV